MVNQPSPPVGSHRGSGTGAHPHPAPTPARPPGEPGTRARLLDAAERLFADFGFNGVSVRQIVLAAGANLSAIPYHFGTKEELFKEVLFRRANPLREERRRLLAELRAQHGALTIEQVLWAMLEPAFRANRDNDAFRRLLGRASMDPAPEVRRLLNEIYSRDFMLVPAVLRAHCAAMDAEEFHWKLNCFYGVMLFVQADTGKIQSIAGDSFDTAQPAIALRYVIPFLAAGFAAPVQPPPNPPRPRRRPKSAPA